MNTPVVKLVPPAGSQALPPEDDDYEDIVLDWSLLRQGPPEVTDVYPDLEHPVP